MKTTRAPKRASTKTTRTAATGQAKPAIAIIYRTFHEKRGLNVWIVTPLDRLDRPAFVRLGADAITAGGWMSQKFNDIPAGWGFTDEEQARDWALAHFDETRDAVALDHERREALEGRR